MALSNKTRDEFNEVINAAFEVSEANALVKSNSIDETLLKLSIYGHFDKAERLERLIEKLKNEKNRQYN